MYNFVATCTWKTTSWWQPDLFKTCWGFG